MRVFTIQDTGGTAKTIARGIELIKEMLPDANRVDAQHRAGVATSSSACNAAAPTAIPASPPTRRSAPRSIGWCAMAARRSCRRRRRSTAPSTC